jgi:hypothetical protein
VRRRRRIWAGAATGAVVVLIAIMACVGLSTRGASAAARTPVPAATSRALQSVPVGILAEASAKVPGLYPATRLRADALVADNKPELLYIGAEFCPVCAAQRWALVVALSQFGTFKNLQETRSAVRDGNIPTFSFHGATYESPYLTFTPVETTTNQPKGNYYQTLETLTPQQEALWRSTLGGTPSFPFLDLGGKYMINTSQFPTSNLVGQSFDQIANSVGHNDTPIGANIDAAAAALVKYICDLTGHQPAATWRTVANVNAPVAAPRSGTGLPAN